MLDVLLKAGNLPSLIIPRSNHGCSTVDGVTTPDLGESLVKSLLRAIWAADKGR
jgi:hypothetical protein